MANEPTPEEPSEQKSEPIEAEFEMVEESTPRTREQVEEFIQKVKDSRLEYVRQIDPEVAARNDPSELNAKYPLPDGVREFEANINGHTPEQSQDGLGLDSATVNIDTKEGVSHA